MTTGSEIGRQPAVDFHLVLPCFRESARLPRYLADLVPFLAAQTYRSPILGIDDGSGGDERRRLDAIREMLDTCEPKGAVADCENVLPPWERSR